MRPAPRHYLLIVLAPLAVLVTGSGLLNLWIDPLNTLRDQRLTTRSYTLPTLLVELGRPPFVEAEIETYLLGTSRTRWGNDTRHNPEILNLAIDGATNCMIDNLLVGLLQNSTRPHVYLVDTMGGREGLNAALEGRLVPQLLSAGTTKSSLLHLAEQIRNPAKPNADSAIENIPPLDLPPGEQGSDKIIFDFLHHTLPIQPHSRATITQRIQRLQELPVPHHALVIYYDGLHSPTSLSDPLIHHALQARTSLWRQVMAERNVAQLNAPAPSSTEVTPPGVTVIYTSLATPADWEDSVPQEVWAPANWWDPLHFKPVAGHRLLERLLIFAAETQQSTTPHR